jgi:hypothetical protein
MKSAHNGDLLYDGLVDRGTEVDLCSAALWVDDALDAIHTHIIQRPQHDLARVVAGVLSAKLHWKNDYSIVHVYT